jgi:hypothetical protein
MKRRLLHIAIIGAALAALSANAQAQVSPLLTPSLKLKDPGSVNSVTIGPPALAAPYTLTLPPNDGDAQQVLTTDGNGVLTWTTQSSGSGTLNTLAKFTSATTIGNSNLSDDGTRVIVGGSLIDVGVWGAAASTVTLGNTNTGSSVNIVGGTNGINIGAAAAGTNITVAGGGNLYTLNLGAGTTLGGITQTINIGNGSTTGVKNVTIGSNATTSSTTLISGSGALNLNASINQPTNINIGTSTGTVSIGNSLSTTAIAGATSITGATTINTTGNANTTIGSATTTGTTTIATNNTSGRFVVSGLPVLTSSTDDVLIVNASNQISRIAQTNLVGSSWQLSGNSNADAWNGTAGSRLGTTSTQPLVLATTNATAQDIRFFTGANGASERMRILGTGNVGIGATNPTSPLTVETATTGNVFSASNTSNSASFTFSVDNAGRASMSATGGTSGISGGAYFIATGREEAWFTVNAVNNTTGLRHMRFGNSSNGVTNAFAIQLLNDAGTAVVTTPFRLQNAAPTNSLVIHTDGNVGLGVAVPTRRLDVAGTIGATGLITGTAGATISGAATSINASSNFATNINTGTSTAAVTIGNTSNATTVGSIATTLKTTIGTNDRVVVASTTGQLDQISPAALVSSAVIGARVATVAGTMSTTVTDANVTTNDIITVTLETSTSTATMPVFTIVRAAGSFVVHFSAPFTGFVNYTIINK